MGVAERKIREQERKETGILDAAERIFAENGFLAATVEDLAHEAEYSIGTLYNTIGNKETILASLVVRIFNHLLEAQPALSHEKKVVPQIKRLFQFYLDFWHAHQDYVRIVRAFETPDIQLRVKPEVLQDLKSRQYSLLDPLFSLIKAGQQSGEVRTDASPAKLSFIFFGFLHSFVQSIDAPQAAEIEQQFGFDVKSVVRKGVDMLLESLTLPQSRH